MTPESPLNPIEQGNIVIIRGVEVSSAITINKNSAQNHDYPLSIKLGDGSTAIAGIVDSDIINEPQSQTLPIQTTVIDEMIEQVKIIPLPGQARLLLERYVNENNSSAMVAMVAEPLNEIGRQIVIAHKGNKAKVGRLVKSPYSINMELIELPSQDTGEIQYTSVKAQPNETYIFFNNEAISLFEKDSLTYICTDSYLELAGADRSNSGQNLSELIIERMSRALQSRTDAQLPFEWDSVAVSTISLSERFQQEQTVATQNIPILEQIKRSFKNWKEQLIAVMDENISTQSVWGFESVLEKLPSDQRYRLALALNAYQQDTTSNLRLSALAAMLNNTDSNIINTEIKNQKAKTSDLKNLLDEETMWEVVNIMIDNKDDFIGPLAAIFSEVSFQEIPEQIRNKIQTQIRHDIDIDVRPWNNEWYLCSLFAGRLANAMEKTAVILVNGNFLVKFDGKMSGLALRTVTDNSGETVIEGGIYAPVDQNSRKQIREAYDAGIPRIKIPDGKWAFMRSWNHHSDGRSVTEVLDETRQYILEMPTDKFPDTIEGKSRKQWRIDNKEQM